MIFWAWLSVVTFALVLVYKIAQIIRLPLSLRWEVYPVPHEEGEKRHYGGSYMEEADWPRKQQRKGGLLAQLLEIFWEVAALKRVRQHNRYGLWPFSLAMHWGIYLLVAWVGLLAGEAILQNVFHLPLPSWPAIFVGVLSFVLGTSGALLLGLKRASSKELSLYTAPIDYFNLLFLLAIFALGLLSWLADPTFVHSRAYVAGVLSLKPATMPPSVAAHWLLVELFFIYMPFSKLIHYMAKYFTFHSALWDDGFKVKGSPIDEQVARQLSYTISWSGPHVIPGKTWLEEAQLTGLEERQA